MISEVLEERTTYSQTSSKSNRPFRALRASALSLVFKVLRALRARRKSGCNSHPTLKVAGDYKMEASC